MSCNKEIAKSKLVFSLCNQLPKDKGTKESPFGKCCDSEVAGWGIGKVGEVGLKGS